jgi:hypothetical protein
VPMGALADAADTFEKSGSGRVLEVRLADTTGVPVFEAALAKGNAVQYLRNGHFSVPSP